MIIRIYESKTLTKRILCKYKCKFKGRKCNSNQKWSNTKCQCEYKNPRKHYVCDKNYIWNPSTCTCENGTYLGSIISCSVIMYDKVVEATNTTPTKTVPKVFNRKKGNL